MDIYKELFIWKAGMWSMCAVQSWERREGGEELQMRWSTCIRPNILADTHTFSDPTYETIMPPNTLISQGDSSVGGERRTEERNGGGRERELMENGVVSQLIGDALPGLQCLLFPSWLPDATMNCTESVTPTVSAEVLGYGL